MKPNPPPLSQSDWQLLRTWRPLDLYKVWSQLRPDIKSQGTSNMEAFTDYSISPGILAGFAVTLVIEPGNPKHPRDNLNSWKDFCSYVEKVDTQKVVVIQDLEKPRIRGTILTECNARLFQSLDCLGAIVDGGTSELNDARKSGFRVLARDHSSSSSWAWPVKFGCDVTVFGCRVTPGMFVHADSNGFVVIPPADLKPLLEKLRFTVPPGVQPTHSMDSKDRGKAVADALSRVHNLDSQFKSFKHFGKDRKSMN